jgi:hypothetical protein
MTYEVVIPENVYKELNEAAIYYEERQRALGQKFLEDWVDIMDLLVRAPLLYEKKFKEFRSIQFQTFPFLIIFEVEGKNIVLFRLIHEKRNPSKRFRK